MHRSRIHPLSYTVGWKRASELALREKYGKETTSKRMLLNAAPSLLQHYPISMIWAQHIRII